MTLQEKKEALLEYFKNLDSVAVAFSGGVDSSFLVRMAKEALGDRALALTVKSVFSPERELKEAAEFCEREHIRQKYVELDVLQVQGVKENPANRCYLCKKEIFRQIQRAARQEGILTIAEGSNLDDNNDYRPGLRAVEEMGIKSPLRELGFSKEEIRMLSKELGLPTWKKPSMACLASRFAYGQTLTEEKLRMVEKAEQRLLDLGFYQFRVRVHEDLARIEVMPEEFSKLMEESVRKQVYAYLKELGFAYAALDLGGYRTGSMNETL